MTVAYAATGAVVTGSGASPVLNPTAAAGDANSRHLLSVTWKSITTPPVVTSGTGTWRGVATEINSSAIATGADVGATHTAVYYADGTCPTGTNVTFTGTIGACQAVITTYSKADAEAYIMDAVVGECNVISGAVSIVSTDSLHTIGSTSGVAVVTAGYCTDFGTISSDTLTGVSLINRVNSASATGDDSRLVVATGGTSELDSARTFTININSAQYTGSMVVVYLGGHIIRYGDSAGFTAITSPTTVLNVSSLGLTSGSAYRNFMFIAWKPSSITTEPTIQTSTGTWRRITSTANSAVVASGPDTGSMRGVLYYADGTCPTGTQAFFTGASVGWAAGQIYNFINDNALFENWTMSTSYGEDGTVGANYTAPSHNPVGLREDDIVAVFTAVNSDAGTYTTTNLASSGIVFGGGSLNKADRDATGDDGGLAMSMFNVNSGTGINTVTYNHTNASSMSGCSVFLRIRMATAPLVDITPLSNFYRNPGYNVAITGMSDFSFFEVIRGDDTDLEEVHIRGGQYQAVTTSSFSANDYEFHFGSTGFPYPRNLLSWRFNFYDETENIAYTVTSNDNSGFGDWMLSVDSEVAGTIPDEALGKTWIVVPDIPSLNCPVNIGDFQEAKFKANILSESHVLGRRNPVIAQDVASGKTGTFTIVILYNLTTSAVTGIPFNVEDYVDFLSTGNVYFMRNIAPLLVGFEDFYFVVNDFEIRRQNRVAEQQAMLDVARISPFGTLEPSLFPIITITVNFTETDPPPNGAVA